MDLVELWDTIPIVHQDNIVNAVASLEEMKKNEFDENNTVGMYKILRRDPWDGSVTDDVEGYLLKVKNNGIESREMFEKEEVAFNRHFDHVVEIESAVKPQLSVESKRKYK